MMNFQLWMKYAFTLLLLLVLICHVKTYEFVEKNITARRDRETFYNRIVFPEKTSPRSNYIVTYLIRPYHKHDRIRLSFDYINFYYGAYCDGDTGFAIYDGANMEADMLTSNCRQTRERVWESSGPYLLLYARYAYKYDLAFELYALGIPGEEETSTLEPHVIAIIVCVVLMVVCVPLAIYLCKKHQKGRKQNRTNRVASQETPVVRERATSPFYYGKKRWKRKKKPVFHPTPGQEPQNPLFSTTQSGHTPRQHSTTYPSLQQNPAYPPQPHPQAYPPDPPYQPLSNTRSQQMVQTTGISSHQQTTVYPPQSLPPLQHRAAFPPSSESLGLLSEDTTYIPSWQTSASSQLHQFMDISPREELMPHPKTSPGTLRMTRPPEPADYRIPPPNRHHTEHPVFEHLAPPPSYESCVNTKAVQKIDRGSRA